MFKNLSIRIKIALVMAIGILINTLLIGAISYINSRNSLRNAYFSQLTSVREIKKRGIEGYFDQIRSQVTTLSEDRMIVDAMAAFKEAFHNQSFDTNSLDFQNRESSMMSYFENEFLPRVNYLGTVEDYMSQDPQSIYFQAQYISDNENPAGSKDNLTRADENSDYNELHSLYHPVIRNYLKEFGYYDIFLVDPETGHIVYSVFKQVDYATSLLSGPFSNTNIADVYNQANNASFPDFVALEDFQQYGPSYQAPASFISSPIFDNEELIGVLIFQMPVDEINKVMTGNKSWESDGLGESGESYIIGQDFTMKSVSRFLIDDPDGYFEALGNAGYSQEIIENIENAGTSILFQKVETVGVENSLMGEVGAEIIKNYRGVNVLSAYAPLNIDGVNWVILAEIDEDEAFAPIIKLRNIVSIAGVIILVVAIIASIFVAKSMAAPIITLTEKIGLVSQGDLTIEVESNSKDEIGTALSGLKNMISKLKEVIGSVMASSEQIALASTEMNHSSQQMSEGSSEQASSAEEVSASIEEMVSNIQQNTDNSRETEKIAKKAAGDIEESNKAVDVTVERMQTIADKISIIGEIARQTNLLALNAAVEAARAGEHGRGFAVVAAEVRKLAERSEVAAGEIDEVSKNSVEVAKKSGELLTNIVPDIRKTSDLVQEITAASLEMTTGADEVNGAIQQLNKVVQRNAANAEEIADTCEELNSQALGMQDMISYFNVGSEFKEGRVVSVKNPQLKFNAAAEKKVEAGITTKDLVKGVSKEGNGTTNVPANGNVKGKVEIDLGGDDKLDNKYEKF